MRTGSIGQSDDGLDEISLPKQNVSRLRSSDHLSIGENGASTDVAQFYLSELPYFSLQFQSGEGFCDLPKLDVGESEGAQRVFRVV